MKFKFLNKTSLTFKRGPVGCLLIHGFTSTPDEMLPLGEFLANHDLSVHISLLPGHGTTPAELARVKWTDWTRQVREDFWALQQTCDAVFVAGLSMGGTLALHLGSHHPVAGIITYAAPVEYYRPIFRWIPCVKNFYRYYPKKHGNDIGDPEMKKRIENYPVYPLPAILEFQKIVSHTFDDLPEIVAPTLVMHSNQDHTIPLNNADLILNRIRSREKQKIIFEKSFHLLTVDFDREQLQLETLKFIQNHNIRISEKK
jgi:carboxylesterase